MHPEIELKLLLPELHPPIATQSTVKIPEYLPPVTQKLYSIYYDTPDHDLRRKDVALRLRREGRRWVQTVKGGGGVAAGLHQRQEWEAPVLKAQPDFTKISGSSLISLFHIAYAAREIATRYLRPSSTGAPVNCFFPAAEVEFCLDRGRDNAGDASVPFVRSSWS